MIEKMSPQHHIQKHIIDILTHKEMARFSELRPSRVDTNLFSYHLKLLIQSGFIAKHDKEYTLGGNGLAYADQASAITSLFQQPKIITMLLIQNSDGQVLLQKRSKQPYINSWTLPYGTVHIDDLSVEVAANREALEKLGLSDQKLRHVGDCYIRVSAGSVPVSITFAHIFRFETDEPFSDGSTAWIDPIKLGRYRLAPAVEQIIARSFFGDECFFTEFEHEWSAT
jgi:ADP-ribose pyrophosphatase YjhB (NUDIX family)